MDGKQKKTKKQKFKEWMAAKNAKLFAKLLYRVEKFGFKRKSLKITLSKLISSGGHSCLARRKIQTIKV